MVANYSAPRSGVWRRGPGRAVDQGRQHHALWLSRHSASGRGASDARGRRAVRGSLAHRLTPAHRIGPALAGVIAVMFASRLSAAEAFRQLNGSEIRAMLSGRELSDGVHWSMRFGAGGKLTTSEAVGRFAPEAKDSGRGTWRVIRDELCLDDGTGGATCHQVWIAGKTVQLRRDGAPPEDGVLH